VIGRADLAPGPRSTQAVHAAFEFAVEHPDATRSWCPGTLVLVESDDLDAFLIRVKNAGVAHTATREPDYDDLLTAVAMEPSVAARRLCANLPLMHREDKT